MSSVASKESALTSQLVRFVLVGALNTAFGYGAYALLVLLGLHYSAAATLGTVAGVLFNFKTTGTLVFRNTRSRLFARFAAVYAFGLAVNLVLLWVLNERMGLGPLVAGAMALPPMVVLTFVMQKRFVFER